MVRGQPQFWRRLALLCMVLLGSSTWSHASAQESPPSNPVAAPTADSSTTTSAEPSDPGQSQTAATATDTSAIQEEVGSRDITYLHDYVLFRYDYKLQVGPTETNRFRLKFLYAFGPEHRLAVTVSVPVMYRTIPDNSAFGSGDTEIVVGGNMYHGETFRMGATFQATVQTASENLLGGENTSIKPGWGFVNVFSDRCELTSAFYYEQSIHTVRGMPVKQFEPDITLNVRMRRVTWFIEYDSYYDFFPGKYAQTMKLGFSRRFGSGKQWVASAYYGAAINHYGTVSQYQYNPGFDLTWYPFKKE